MRKFAIIMQLPDGKLPGFYAQVIKALATKAHVFDRQKEVLIISNYSELALVEQILEHYSIASELIPVFHIPNSAIFRKHIDDFGFTTLSGNTFLYEPTLILFTLQHSLVNSDDFTMALSQLDEHIITSFELNKTIYYIAENHLQECIYGIAKAYGCTFDLEKIQE